MPESLNDVPDIGLLLLYWQTSEQMKSEQNPAYSIVVPFFNEQESVAQLYVKITEVMDTIGESYEMVFVDDGSKDGTCRRLAEVAGADRRVSVVKVRRSFGQTGGLKGGF